MSAVLWFVAAVLVAAVTVSCAVVAAVGKLDSWEDE